MLTKRYSGVAAYCQSKLAQIMFTIDLAEEFKGSGVIVNALHPSTYMNTTMVKRSGISPMSRVEDGAEAILQLAVSPKLEGRSGLYFNVLNEARANPQAYDAEARRKLRRSASTSRDSKPQVPPPSSEEDMRADAALPAGRSRARSSRSCRR